MPDGRRAAPVAAGPEAGETEPAVEGLAAEDGIVCDFRLYPITPAVAAEGFEIGFDLPEDAPVRLLAFDVSGRRVGSVLERLVRAGRHAVRWDTRGLADGIFFLRLEAGPRRATLRVVLAR